MFLFLWSLVADAVDYVKRQRFEQEIRTYVNRSNKLVFRRKSVQLKNGSTFDGADLQVEEKPELLNVGDWQLLAGAEDECFYDDDSMLFVAVLARPDNGRPSSQSIDLQVEADCVPIACSSDVNSSSVLYRCKLDKFLQLLHRWLCNGILFDELRVEELRTVALRKQQLTLGKLSNGSLLTNGNDYRLSPGTSSTVVSYTPTTGNCCVPTTENVSTTLVARTLDGGRSTNLDEEDGGSSCGVGGGLSRSSILCSLEQLCLSDILAAKDLCRSIGTFSGLDQLSATNMTGKSVSSESVILNNRTSNGSSQVNDRGTDTSSPNGAPSTVTVATSATERPPSWVGSRSVSSTPSVDAFGDAARSDAGNWSVDHMSPCHGYNDRLLDRRWYSTWRCDRSTDSNEASVSSGVITRQPTGSRSSSRRRAKQRSPLPTEIPISRRWSLPSPPKLRSRSSSLGRIKFPLTPALRSPNILICTGSDDSSTLLYGKLADMIRQCVSRDHYTVYRLKNSHFLIYPWMSHAACLVLADVELDDQCWQRLFEYFKMGGKMFFICENRLLAGLRQADTEKKRYGLLKLAFDGSFDQRRKDFKEFLKKLSKSLDQPSVSEHFNVIGADGRLKYTLSVVREERTPLILYMQNGQDRAGALFSDMTLSAVMSEGRSLITDVLQRLGIKLETTAPPSLSPGYLILDEQINDDVNAKQVLLSVGRVDGHKASIEFFDSNTVPNDRVSPSKAYLPVWIGAETDDFNKEVYFEHLKTRRLGRCVVFVPVATSTMDYCDGLLPKLPDDVNVVFVAKYQLEGQGRNGNSFLSPVGCAAFTVGLRMSPQCRLADAPGYVQHLLALAAVDSITSLENLEGFHLKLKWPNDIYYGAGRLVKIGGVLVNYLAKTDARFFVAGLGLNVANDRPTTCLNRLLPPELPPFSVEQVIAMTLTRFEQLLTLFEQRGPDIILPLYYKYWIHGHQELTLSDSSERVAVRGLDKCGYLEVRSRHTGKVFSVRPDGNALDPFQNLVKIR